MAFELVDIGKSAHTMSLAPERHLGKGRQIMEAIVAGFRHDIFSSTTRSENLKIECNQKYMELPKMSSFHYYSYPIDHFDPRIRYRVDRSDAVGKQIEPFLNQEARSQSLRHLGDSLAPSRKDVASANEVVTRVVHALQNCSMLSVDRCCVSGSLGKRTSVVQFDIDLVVFVNDSSLPFAQVISHLEKYVPAVLPGTEIEKTTRCSLQFILDGFQVDLLPAQNLAPGLNTGNHGQAQYAETLQKLVSMPECDRFLWSGAFAESTVEFMKQKQPFVNAAVRICKLRKRTCRVTSNTFPPWFSSFLIEIMAIDAAQRELEEHSSNASVALVLTRFLRGLASPETLRIIVSDRYSERDIPEALLRKRSLVMDPVNPYNNVASRLRDWSTIRVLARHTLDSLSKPHALIGDVFSKSRLGDDLPRLFEYCNFHLKFVMTGSFLRTLSVEKITDLNGERMKPGVEWRKDVNENICSEGAKQHVVSMLEAFVSVTTTTMFHHMEGARTREVKASSNFLDDVLFQVFNKPKSEWSSTSLRHQDCDVSLTFGQIPLPSQADDLRYILLKLSFNVDNDRFYRLAHQFNREMERRADEEDLY